MLKQYSYIKASEEFCTRENFVPAPYLRKTFKVSKPVKSATLYITGQGFYELHFNGIDITKGFLAPYRSNPDDIVYFDKYDVTDLIKNGNNVIATILGNGMQNGLGAYVWDFDKAHWRSAPILCFELTIEYEDGTEETVISNTDTKTHSSPILFDDLHFGEYYDASLEIEGWDLPDFDDSSWSNALVAVAPKGKPRLCEADPITLRKTLLPISVTECGDGFVYDFGLNNSGLCELNIKNTTKGQKLVFIHVENMKEGKPCLHNVRFVPSRDLYQEDIYYCAGKKCEKHFPRFTYHGFRYVYVEGITKEQATYDLLKHHVFNSDIKKIGHFVCDNGIANKLQEAAVRSDLSNFHYFPTDCPHREKNGWTADASLSAEQMLLNLDPERSYKEWMRNIYAALDENGELPSIIPTPGWGKGGGNCGPSWDIAIVNIPYYVYLLRGDTEILKELSEPLFKYLKYLSGRVNEDNLVKVGLGDWCQAGQKGNGPATPLLLTASISSADIANKAAFIYEVLGDTEKYEYAKALADRISKAIKEKLIDHETMTALGASQTGQALLLHYGYFEEHEREAAFKRLLDFIEERDNHIAIGVLGNLALYRVLSDFGYEDLAFDMLTRTDYPSLGNWIAEGATTLWENFVRLGNYPAYSLNHHFWGDISAWFYTYIAGLKINPSKHDVNEVNIAPVFIKKLNFVQADHILPSGKIAVEWKRDHEVITLTLAVPDAVYGKIILPNGYSFEDGNTNCKLASGSYKIIKA